MCNATWLAASQRGTLSIHGQCETTPQVGVSYQEYRSRLADTKIKVNRFLEGSDTASDAGLHVVDAMAYFEQAALT